MGPFDIRWIFYNDAVVERSRKEVMRHMMKESLGLILPKRVETKIPWKHVLCTNEPIEHVAVSLKTIDYLFPLYLYPETRKKTCLARRKSQRKDRSILVLGF
ncbi:MAG: type ISP restriction/modification enzyme [Thermodesulfobacteriota bacterium]